MADGLVFNVKCDSTQPGDGVFIVGSAPELGAWSFGKGVACTTTADTFPTWTSKPVPVSAAGRVEFKVVIGKGSSDPNPRWENGNNKVIEASSSGLTTIKCSFGSSNVESRHQNGGYTPDAKAQPPKKTEEKKVEDVPPPKTSEQPLKEADEAPLKTASFSAPLQRNKSRHLVSNKSGEIDMDMSRTPSLMMVNFDDFHNEAQEMEEKVEKLERERLNVQQRRMASGTLLEAMKKITDYADPSEVVMLQGFNWESHKAGKGNWYGIVKTKVQMLADLGITDIWLPPCSASVAPQGYLPSQLFNLDGSAYGTKDALKDLLETMHDAGIRGVADIVVNHRCGDVQDSQGRWNVFTNTGIEHRKSFAGVMDWEGWAITLGDKFSDGTGERGPGQYDGKFDAAPDIDHGNKKVQQSIAIWMRWLRLEVGFDAWRFDFVKGYGSEYVGLYCKKTEPAWAVGELWLDMAYDDNGLCHNQDKHRQDTINWINGTGKLSTAFDFTTKGILQEAVRNCQYWRLRDGNGKPPGLLGWMPTHAVTFLDNHDTGSTQQHWPFPNDKVQVGYAYILTHPGIPSIFWDHVCDWGDDMRNKIKALLSLRRQSGIKANSKVNIMCADQDLYIAEIGEPASLRVALGPRGSGADGGYWQDGAAGQDWRVWISKAAAKK